MDMIQHERLSNCAVDRFPPLTKADFTYVIDLLQTPKFILFGEAVIGEFDVKNECEEVKSKCEEVKTYTLRVEE